MKKFLTLLLIITISVLPALAGNVLQQQDELKLIQKLATNSFSNNFDKTFLIMEDYYGYFNDKDSMYGEIVNMIKDLSLKESKYTIDIKYLTLAKTKIEEIVNIKNSPNSNNPLLFKLCEKIYINDEDYLKMKGSTREEIIFLNIMLFN